jgi:hypothetical protein
MAVRRIQKGEPGHGSKKFVATGTYQGKPYTVRFGDPDMDIKRDNPEARRNFRSRMNCAKPGPPNQARYWACKFWSDTPVSELLGD